MSLRRWGSRRSPLPSVLALLVLGLIALGVVSARPSSGAPAAVVSPAPLDPLSAAEIATVYEVVQASPEYPAGGFPHPEPEGADEERACGFVARQAVLAAGVRQRLRPADEQALRGRRRPPHAEARVLGAAPGLPAAGVRDRVRDVEALVRADPRWKKAMRDRGIDPDDVYLDSGWGVGDITRAWRSCGNAADARAFVLPGRAAEPVRPADRRRDRDHRHEPPKVVEVLDSGIRPVNKTISGNAGTTRPGLKPLTRDPTERPEFQAHRQRGRVAGLAPSGRLQPARRTRPLSDRLRATNGIVRLDHPPSLAGRDLRSVRDPGPHWSWRAAQDIGEYNLGQLRRALRRRTSTSRRTPSSSTRSAASTPESEDERGRTTPARGRDLRARRGHRSGTAPTRPPSSRTLASHVSSS